MSSNSKRGLLGSLFGSEEEEFETSRKPSSTQKEEKSEEVSESKGLKSGGLLGILGGEEEEFDGNPGKNEDDSSTKEEELSIKTDIKEEELSKNDSELSKREDSSADEPVVSGSGLLSTLGEGEDSEGSLDSWFTEQEEEERREREEVERSSRENLSESSEQSELKSEQSELNLALDSEIEEADLSINKEDNDNANIDDDLLMGMLDSFEDDELERAKARTSLDEDVVVPLEKDGMDEIIVSKDGKTLAEVIPGLRRGPTRSTEKMYELIRNQELVEEVQGKKFSDSRYSKHAKKIEEERAKEEEKMKLSLEYYQKNAKFTEQEKIMMKNLGLDGDNFSKIMQSKELSKKDKEEIISLGRYGPERHFKGRRYRTTVGDMAILEYLTKFKFANTRILRWLSDESQRRTWRKMNRLRDSGLVESQTVLGLSDLWGATTAGVALTGYGYEPGLRPMPKIPTISATMGVNYLAACLWFNTVNVLNLDDFPAENRIIPTREDGSNRTRGEMLVSEYEIRSSLGKEINPNSTTMQTLGDERLYDVIASNVREEFERWEQGGKLGESPEFSLGNEYMWVLYPTSQLTLSYHVPDLVVQRERGPNGEPRSIAVEVERHEKSNDRYDQIMLAYKLDEHLYEKVIWVTPNTRTARALVKAAKEVGFNRYSILPILTKDGVYNKQDMWMI